MKSEDYLSIGEMAEFCQISTRTLRFYDKINLLKPAYVDPDNHRRYYKLEQFSVLEVIARLKYMGFSLSEIQNFLKTNDFSPAISLFKQKNDEYDFALKEIKQKQQIINSWTHGLTKWNNIDDIDMSITVKDVDERYIASIRQTVVFTLKSVFQMTRKIDNIIKSNDFLHLTGSYIVGFYDEYDNINPKNCELEIGKNIIVSKDNFDTTLPFIHKIPACTYVMSHHRGKYEDSIAKYLEMKDYIIKNNFTINGPVYNISVFPIGVAKTEDRIVRLIQIPVIKK